MDAIGITELTGTQYVTDGGHNWPDMKIVIDPEQTAIEKDGIYLVEVRGRSPTVKRCAERDGSIYLHPALSPVHGQNTVVLFGRKVPCQTVEFSDSFYRRDVTVHGRMVGFWVTGE